MTSGRSSESDITTQLDALRHATGVAPLNSGWIAVTGADRVRWLNGMVTNSVSALTPGDGAYTFILSAQGRIQGDATVWAPCPAQPDRLLLQTSAAQLEQILTLLDRFIIMDDVELEPIEHHGLLIAGPTAADTLAAIGIPARPSKLLKHRAITWHGHSFILLNTYSPLAPRFELWAANPDDVAAVRAALLPGAPPSQQAQVGSRPAEVTETAVELFRILEGTPLVGTDIRDRDLPQETAQTRALHFNKGCYLGQEIVERIRSRGNVHRTFTAFVLTGNTPPVGTPFQADGKPVGELTSIASSLIDGEQLALGFIRREALERGLALTHPGGTVTLRTAAAITIAPEPLAPTAAS